MKEFISIALAAIEESAFTREPIENGDNIKVSVFGIELIVERK